MDMTTRKPRIRPVLGTADKIIEILSLAGIVIFWVMIGFHYAKLPDIIPVHFNSAGEADGFGGKIHLLILPIVATVFFLGLTLLNRYPYIFNYPVHITEGNALAQYTIMTRMIRLLKLALVIVFSMISFKAILHMKGCSNGLGCWFLPITLLLIFLPIVYYFVQSFRAK